MASSKIKEDNAKISIDETSLEDLIVLGEDKLINIHISYPTEEGTVEAKAKIKQLTMKELKNIDVNNPSLNTNVQILSKALFKQDETLFSKEMILALPLGVVNAVCQKILEVSGVETDLKGFSTHELAN